MEKAAFRTLVKRMSEESKKGSHIDWTARKMEWLAQLDSFYAKIHDFLSEFTDQGQIKILNSKVFLQEENIGRYQAEARTIVVGLKKITLNPIGTNIIGARGRVDMTGPSGTVRFILTGEHSNGLAITVTIHSPTVTKQASQRKQPEEDVWKIVTPPPKIRFIDLTPETFFSALNDVLQP